MGMQDKVVVVTGSNDGIGKETAVGVAAQGATTVLACRNQKKMDAAAQEITRRTGNADVHVVVLDLADLASVRAAATEILARWDRLNVLINNAGGIWTQRQETAQGFEQTFGVNHLGHFLLTELLLARIKESAPSRIINLTSVGHHAAWRGMRFDDLQSERRYATMDAYGRSKLANILFTRELAARLAGTGVTVIRPFEISPALGARTSVYLATSPEVEGETGRYWVRRKPGHMSRQARSNAQAQRLWSESERLVSAAGFTTEP